ncbi:hypothetical protein ACH5RR_027508 [Cinchona calisaya]|uniref:Uncharacterized protein n=1 Tax=Cinchona calisaya TaxID=153742 RepID=A0ABD2Z5Q1_9GENT
MSRCFPYPPPGYKLNKACNGALIDSIKLQKERENAKAERKKEKRESKEKKKAQEVKAKIDHDTPRGESWDNIKGGFLQKERKEDSEQLERSSITEEHEKPVCSQNPSYSSDSTENSSKRKRHGTSLNGNPARGHILRIRLRSQKCIQNDIKGCDEQLCSTSGRIDKPAEHKNDAIRADPDKSCSSSLASDFIVHGLPRPDKELTQANSSRQPDITSEEIMHADSGSSRYKKLKRVAERYRDLIENWTPPSQLGEHMVIDDEDWLFGRKHQQKQPEKNVRQSSEVSSCSSSSSLWPRAHYLPDLDIYALPYSVPF